MTKNPKNKIKKMKYLLFRTMVIIKNSPLSFWNPKGETWNIRISIPIGILHSIDINPQRNDMFICYNCNKSGHMAQNCKNMARLALQTNLTENNLLLWNWNQHFWWMWGVMGRHWHCSPCFLWLWFVQVLFLSRR